MSFLAESWLANQPELSAALAAFLLAPLIAFLHLVFLALSHKRHGLTLLVIACICYLAFWFIVVFWIKDRVFPAFPEIVVGCSLAGFFSLGYLQVYSLAYRGFSLRIVMEVFRNGSLNIAECAARYNKGLGVDWLIEDRLAGLVALRLIRREGNVIALRSPFARLAGKAGGLVKRLLQLGKAG